MKICSKCEIEKELMEFHKQKISKDGHRSICKECRKEEGKKYYEENQDIIIEKTKEYRKENKGYIETNKKYKEDNKEFVDELKREWSVNNMSMNIENKTNIYMLGDLY